MEGMIVGIGIGNSEISMCICRADKLNGVTILGKSISYCDGITRGVIVDIDSAARAISNCVKQIDKTLGIEIMSGYVSVIGEDVDIVKSRCSIDIGNESREIVEQDIRRAFLAVKNVDIGKDRQVIDIIPESYSVDGYPGIVDPICMYGKRLEILANNIVARVGTVQNIVKSMQMAGLRVDGIVAESLAIGEIALTPNQKETGAILIDVGQDITSISKFEKGYLEFCGCISVGGDHITSDIAIGLKISNSNAEKLKLECGIALPSLIKNDTTMEVDDVEMNDKKNVKISQIVEIIEARVREIFELCRDVLEKQDMSKESTENVVLSGSGILSIDGSQQIAQDIFGVPVLSIDNKEMRRIGEQYILAVGIVRYVVSQNRGQVGNANSKVRKKQDSSKVSRKSKLGRIFENLAKLLDMMF